MLLFQIIEKTILTVAPIFLLVAVGYFFARRRPLDTGSLNEINLQIFLPALIFNALATAVVDWNEIGWIAAYGAGIVLGSGVAAYPVCRYFGWSAREILPPMMFTNYGNMGLPLLPLAFGEEALSLAVVLFIVGNTLHVTVGFVIYGKSIGRLGWRDNPMFVAAVCGILFNLSGWVMPSPLALTVEMAAMVAIPLMLFALGVRMREVDKEMVVKSVFPALLCPASGLVCCLLLWWLVPLPAEKKWMIVLFAALPPALLNYIYADRFGLNAARVASIVMTGNLLAVAVIPATLLVIYYFRSV